MTMEEAVIKALAKKKGISEEEAQVYVEAFKNEYGEQEFQNLVNTITGVAQAAQNLPPDAQKLLLAAASQHMANSGGGMDESLAKLAAIKALFGDSDDKLKGLEEQIKQLMEEKQKNEFLETVKQLQDNMNAQIQALQQQIQALQENHQNKDEVDVLVEKLNEVEEKKQKLQELLGVKQEEKFDVVKAAEELKKLGYEVKEPTSALMERLKALEDNQQKLIEQAKKEAREEALRQAEVQKMWIDFGSNVFTAVMDMLTPAEKGNISNVIQKGLAALKKGAAQATAQG